MTSTKLALPQQFDPLKVLPGSMTRFVWIGMNDKYGVTGGGEWKNYCLAIFAGRLMLWKHSSFNNQFTWEEIYDIYIFEKLIEEIIECKKEEILYHARRWEPTNPPLELKKYLFIKNF